MADDGQPIEGPALKTVVGMIKDMEYQVGPNSQILYFVFCILYFVFLVSYFVFCISYFAFCRPPVCRQLQITQIGSSQIMCDMLQGDFCLWIRIAKPGNKNKWLVVLHSSNCTATHESLVRWRWWCWLLVVFDKMIIERMMLGKMTITPRQSDRIDEYPYRVFF